MDDTSISPDMSFGRSVSLNSANFADSRLFACIAWYIGATTDSNSARRSAEGTASSIALSMSVVMLGTAEPAFMDARSLPFTKWNTNFAVPQRYRESFKKKVGFLQKKIPGKREKRSDRDNPHPTKWCRIFDFLRHEGRFCRYNPIFWRFISL